MKRFFVYLLLPFLAILHSCSQSELIHDRTVPVNKDKIKVQGLPYDLSKSDISQATLRFFTKSNSLNGGDPSFTMDSIQFWVGQGTKKAALVIEWHDGKTPDAMVWGYRWSGDAYGIDMIKAIVKADSRLIFLTHMTGPMGYTIAGLGYDIDKKGPHYLIFDGNINTPQHPVEGIVTTSAYNYDDWTYSDRSDHWSAGWYSGYWSYWVRDSTGETWEYSNWGASSRKLVDGSWDGWSFLGDMSQWGGNKLGDKFIAAPLN